MTVGLGSAESKHMVRHHRRVQGAEYVLVRLMQHSQDCTDVMELPDTVYRL